MPSSSTDSRVYRKKLHQHIFQVSNILYICSTLFNEEEYLPVL
jgi:hypothetical protein